MGRRKSEKPKRNAVAVRFDDDELAAVEDAIGDDADVSPWVRDAAVEKARRCLARRERAEDATG